MNIKELVTIEFRYHDIPKTEFDDGYAERKITIGLYDTLEEAIENGNKALSTLAKHFKFTKFFGLHNGCFGNPERLVTDFYTIKGIQVFAKITPLKFDNLEDVIYDVLNSQKRYNSLK